MSGEVLLGYVSGGWGRIEFFNSVLNAVSGPEADPAIGGVISSSAGPLLALGRNLLVKQFLSHGKEWLCSIDTDIVFANDAISRLLEVAHPEERPVVSALYHIFWEGRKIPAAYKASLDTEGGLIMGHLQEVPENCVTRVDATGAGMLLVHRSVFENIQESTGQDCWFHEMVIDSKDIGEDISFAFRCAAVEAHIYLHTGVQVGHIKSAMLGKVTLWPSQLRSASQRC